MLEQTDTNWYKFAEIEQKDAYMFILGGYRHPKPDKCPAGVYNLMLNCWNVNASLRPSFAEIHSILAQFDTFNDRRYDLTLPYLRGGQALTPAQR